MLRPQFAFIRDWSNTAPAALQAALDGLISGDTTPPPTKKKKKAKE